MAFILVDCSSEKKVMEFGLVSVTGMGEYIDSEHFYNGYKEDRMDVQGINRRNMIEVFKAGYYEYLDCVTPEVAQAIGIENVADYLRIIRFANNGAGIIVLHTGDVVDKNNIRVFRECVLDTMRAGMQAQKIGVKLAYINKEKVNRAMNKYDACNDLQRCYHIQMLIKNAIDKAIKKKLA